MLYRQCLLVKSEKIYQLAWIPRQFAVVGKPLRLRDEDGWVVDKVYSSCPVDYLLTYMQDAHRDWRSVTDI